jgi:hypothetical protein
MASVAAHPDRRRVTTAQTPAGEPPPALLDPPHDTDTSPLAIASAGGEDLAEPGDALEPVGTQALLNKAGQLLAEVSGRTRASAPYHLVGQLQSAVTERGSTATQRSESPGAGPPTPCRGFSLR